MRTQNMKIMKSKAGFTLIEILVVIGIIALLASIVFVRFNSARARARDAERVSEVKTLQNALALYFTNQNAFPVETTSTVLTGTDSVSVALLNENTVPAIPADPINTGVYQYSYSSDSNGATYVIEYSLETDSILGKDGAESGSNGGTPNPQRATP